MNSYKIHPITLFGERGDLFKPLDHSIVPFFCLMIREEAPLS